MDGDVVIETVSDGDVGTAGGEGGGTANEGQGGDVASADVGVDVVVPASHL